MGVIVMNGGEEWLVCIGGPWDGDYLRAPEPGQWCVTCPADPATPLADVLKLAAKGCPGSGYRWGTYAKQWRRTGYILLWMGEGD